MENPPLSYTISQVSKDPNDASLLKLTYPLAKERFKRLKFNAFLLLTYRWDIAAVAQQKLMGVRVVAVDGLADVDKVHFVVVPQHVVLTQVAVH